MSNTNMFDRWYETKVSKKILESKYYHTFEDGNKEDFEAFIERITKPFGELSSELLSVIKAGDFIMAGSMLAGLGIETKKKISLSNCNILPSPKDSLDSIFEVGKQMAKIFSRRGGCGVNLSNLRPNGAKVYNSANTSTGSISFAKYYNEVCSVIGSHGRRAALMIALSCTHPDIEEFLIAKMNDEDIRMANLSIIFTDDFMDAVENRKEFELYFNVVDTGEEIRKTIDAYTFFMKFCEVQWSWAEPGSIFIDRVRSHNLLSGYPKEEYNIECCNPCVSGDTLVITKEGEVPIKDLVGIETIIWNGYQWSKVTPKVTGKNQKMKKITIELHDMSGDTKKTTSVLNCTEYHTFVLKEKGERVEAKDLKVGDYLEMWCLPTDLSKLVIGVITQVEDRDREPIVYCFDEPINHTGVFNGIMTGQCAEFYAPEYNACSLASINLYNCVDNAFTSFSFFNFEKLARLTRLGVEVLDKSLDLGYKMHPLEELRHAVDDWRSIGLGTLGLADMFVALGIRYGSSESRTLVESIYETMLTNALIKSEELGKKLGNFDKFNAEKFNNSLLVKSLGREYKYMRNATLLSIAPTGSIALLLGVSSGVESYYQIKYDRTTHTNVNDKTGVKFTIFAKAVEHLMKIKWITENELPKHVVTALDIQPLDRVKMQASMQKYVDNAISSTVNVPEDTSIEEVFNIYMAAWKLGLKGLTIFRENCPRTSILGKKETKKIANTHTPVARKNIKKLNGSTIIESTACVPKMYVTVNEKDGKPFEVFTNASTGCKANIATITRLISLALRSGIDVDHVIKELKENSCQACVMLKTKEKDTSLSCSHAIANAIEVFLNKEEVKTTDKQACPECGEHTLIPTGKCVQCTSCFYSKCE